MESLDEYEVAVVGGGPAGAAAALCLTRAGHRVVLADSADPKAFKIGETLPPAARTLLHDLGLWAPFEQEGHLACPGNLAAWGSDQLQGTEFVFDPNGPGWHLDRARFDRFLRTEARAAGTDVRERTVVRHPVTQHDGSWRLELEDRHGHTTIRCRWVIDATGRRSAIARSQGAQRHREDALIGLFVRLHPDTHAGGRPDHDARTLIEATRQGWWYSALLPSGHRVLAYHTDADLIQSCSPTLGGYRTLLSQTRHLHQWITTHGHTLDTTPRGAPAQSCWLQPPLGPGWLATGDAAMAFDPLSSQGILTALFTGMAAGQALHAHLAGDEDALTAYGAQLLAIRAAYRRNLTMTYGLERRWPQQPFWRRRLTEPFVTA